MNKKAVIVKILQRISHRRSFEHKPFESSSIGDLAFLLLIYFIVTSSFILRQGIFFSLPAMNSGSIKLMENQIVEVYPKNDGFLYGENRINRKQFSRILKKHRVQDKDKVLIIKMGADIEYDRLVDTLSVAKESGMNRVSLKNIFQEESP